MGFPLSGRAWTPPRCGAWASYCGGFSHCGAQAPGPWASVVTAQPLRQLRLAGSRALRLQWLQHRGSSITAHGPHSVQASAVAAAGSVVGARGLSCSVARGIFPGQGPKPMPPPWTAGFLPTVPPGKFCCPQVLNQVVFLLSGECSLCTHNANPFLQCALQIFSPNLWLFIFFTVFFGAQIF